MITVCDAMTTLNDTSEGIGTIEVAAVSVSVDEAADLADNLTGGPLVCVAPWAMTQYTASQVVIKSWRLYVRAFIEAEVYDALYQAAELLAGVEVTYPRWFRLRDGELVPCTAGTGFLVGQ